jgi:hypothetical protein
LITRDGRTDAMPKNRKRKFQTVETHSVGLNTLTVILRG